MVGHPAEKIMKCSKHTEDQLDAFFASAIQALNEWRLNESRESLEHLLESHTDCVEEWNIREFLGECYYYLDRYSQAIQTLEPALDEILHLRSEAPIDSELAIAELHTRKTLGLSYFALERYECAIASFEQAEPLAGLYRDTNWWLAEFSFYLNYGRALLYDRRREESLQKFLMAEAYLKERPRDSHVVQRLNLLDYEIGRVLVWMRRLEDAQIRLERVDPTKLERSHDRGYYFTMLKLAFLSKRFELVDGWFQKYASAEQDKQELADGAYMAAVSAYSLGSIEQARELVAFIKLNSSDENLSNQVTELERNLDKG